MTAVPRPTVAPRIRSLPALRAAIASRAVEDAWALPAFLGVVAIAAVTYFWNLTVSGYANTYYSAAALAGSQSWSAFFFGSFDAANFITVDKPPLAIMTMALSVRLFGLSSLSVLAPEALAGVATVVVLFFAVRHSFGSAAGLIAALVMALTPAAALMFRFNNPDALLTLLLVVAAWALLRSLEHGSYRWVALSAAMVGLAFLTKYLQAYLVLPAFALVFGFSASTNLRRRIVGLVVALASVLVASGWWVAIVQLIPLGSRPFIGGSTTGSPLDLIFGYDGLGRIFGGGGGAGAGGGGGGGFSGEVGLFRLFNDQMFGEIAWFIPLAVVGLVVGLALRNAVARTDRGLAGYLLWGGWFAVTAVVFSYMSGIIHSYYAVALAPAVAALAGAGLVDLWRLRVRRFWIGAPAVGLALLGTASWGAELLGRTPSFAPGVGTAAVALAALAAAVLALAAVPSLRRPLRRAATVAAVAGLAAALLAPGAYDVATANTAYSSGDPHPGPGAASEGFGGGPGGFAGIATPPGQSGSAAGPAASVGGGGFGGAFGNGVAGDQATGDSALLQYLVANRGGATWVVAANGANEAGRIELATGLPVMAMGGFSGSDPAPTLAQLQSYVAAGKLRFVLVGGRFGGGPGGESDVSSWVTSACKAVDYGSGSSSLYDCAGAVG